METNIVTFPVPSTVSEADAKLLLAVKLFETGKISLGKAAEYSGYSYRSFLEVLRQQKIPVANYSPEDLEKEVAG